MLGRKSGVRVWVCCRCLCYPAGRFRSVIQRELAWEWGMCCEKETGYHAIGMREVASKREPTCDMALVLICFGAACLHTPHD